MATDDNSIADSASRLDESSRTFDTDDVIDRYEGRRQEDSEVRSDDARGSRGGSQGGGVDDQNAGSKDGERRASSGPIEIDEVS
jgi:hypothetical protein